MIDSKNNCESRGTRTTSRVTVRLIGVLAAAAAEVFVGLPAFSATAPKAAAPAAKPAVHSAPPASHASMVSRNPHLHGFTSERAVPQHEAAHPAEHEHQAAHPAASEHDAAHSAEHEHEVAHPAEHEHDAAHPHVAEHEVSHAHLGDRFEHEEIRHEIERHHLRAIEYQRWWDHHWIYTGDFRTWYVAHTGLGEIQGTVAVNGVAVSGATVVLRKPGGRIFRIRANKHLTHTNSLGHFTMLAVHPGSYRIVTQFSKAERHAQIQVAPGVTVRTHFEF